MNKILIVDDEKPLRDTLAKWFHRDYECLTAPDGDVALKMIEENPDLALVITDERMPQMTGTELLRKAKAKHPDLSFIMLTAYGSLDLAVEAMRNGGADDFYQKPITDMKAFEAVVAKAAEKAPLKRELATLESKCSRASKMEIKNFTGHSPAMEKIYAIIRKVAPANANVLIEGSSGTGKELVARALHDLSKRAKGPFVAVECAALSEQLLETELFGYNPGTFTNQLKEGKKGKFESAAGGTLFLDEIGEISKEMQVKLLRALETRVIQRVGGTEDIPVDFRLVAATNRNLAAMVAEGKFRSDLYYRLNIIRLEMPPLKDRPGDIRLLVDRFLKEFSAANGGQVTGIDEAAMSRLENYAWPGNVRELRNIVERMVILAGGSTLGVDDLPEELTSRPIPPPAESNIPACPSALTLADREKAQILATIEQCGGNRSKAAELLGISRRTLQRKFKEWNI